MKVEGLIPLFLAILVLGAVVFANIKLEEARTERGCIYEEECQCKADCGKIGLVMHHYVKGNTVWSLDTGIETDLFESECWCVSNDTPRKRIW